MAQKGISLPINMIVILAIAVLVLVVVAAFFVLQVGAGGQTINDQTAWGNGCSTAIARGCSVSAFQSPGEGTDSGLLIARYDPSGNDPKDENTKSSKCFSDSDLHDDDKIGCRDNTLRTACERTQGVSGAAACRAKCCGS